MKTITVSCSWVQRTVMVDTIRVPDNWDEMSQEDQDKYIRDEVEGCPPEHDCFCDPEMDSWEEADSEFDDEEDCDDEDDEENGANNE